MTVHHYPGALSPEAFSVYHEKLRYKEKDGHGVAGGIDVGICLRGFKGQRCTCKISTLDPCSTLIATW